MNEKHMNPYLAGFLLGLVLLLTIFVTGRGLGASGAVKNVVVAGVGAVAPQHAAANPFYSKLLAPGHEAPLKGWLVFEVLGVLLGAFVSGLTADRLKLVTERGPRVSVTGRLLFAALGGALFGAGAQLARGCTSGAALSGMAVLSVAGFVTMLAIFGSGFLFAWFTRSLWLGAKAGR
ncbi:MAG: YeeE/YedE thiosulfate transporter family protein [Thermoanaerobaculia bacterium]